MRRPLDRGSKVEDIARSGVACGVPKFDERAIRVRASVAVAPVSSTRSIFKAIRENSFGTSKSVIN
jgi:hypothetical protein